MSRAAGWRGTWTRLRGLLRPGSRLRQAVDPSRVDSGFTLLETIVAVTLLGIVMTATTAYFITANRSSRDLGHLQVATQLANDAIEQANSMQATNLGAGRGATFVDQQLSAANPSVRADWLGDSAAVSDASAVPCLANNTSGCLPTEGVTSRVDGIVFTTNSYVGLCYRRAVDSAQSTQCNSSASLPSDVPFFRVVAAVTWQTASCPATGCYFATATLVNDTAQDPVFNPGVAGIPPQPLQVAPVANQATTAGSPVYLQLKATGGTGGDTWTATGLPTGWTIDSTGIIGGVAPSASAPVSLHITVTVTDSTNQTTPPTPFTWTINPAPAITSPIDGSSITLFQGQAMNLVVIHSGGTAPFTWSTPTLPPGLNFNVSSDGQQASISGTPTVTGSTRVPLTLTDTSGISAGQGASASADFTFVVSEAAQPPANLVLTAGDGSLTASWDPSSAPLLSYSATINPGAIPCPLATSLSTKCTVSTGLTNGVRYTVSVTATNVNNTSGPSTASATPYPASVMGNGMSLWLDGADASTLLQSSTCTGAPSTSGGPVGCWRDKSNQSENVIQAAGSAQPSVASMNGLPALNFPTNAAVLTTADPNDTFQTVFTVTVPQSVSGWNYLFGQAGADFSIRVAPNHLSNPDSQDWGYSSSQPPPLDWTNTQQGVDPPLGSAAIITAQSATPRTFAASISSSFLGRGLVGTMAEVIAFKSTLTPAQRRAVEEYLARKWAVPISAQAPLSPTATVASTSTSTSTRSATVNWAAPGWNGGAAVTGYTVTASPGPGSCTTTGALSCVVTGLTQGTPYSFTVVANNGVGAGPVSASTPEVTP